MSERAIVLNTLTGKYEVFERDLVDVTQSSLDAVPQTVPLFVGTIPDNEAADVRLTVWARQYSGIGTIGDVAKFVIEALVTRSGSVLTIKDEHVVSVYKDQALWNAYLSSSGVNLNIVVRGETSKTIRWRCRAEASYHG
jgi:hypothetical protein